MKPPEQTEDSVENAGRARDRRISVKYLFENSFAVVYNFWGSILVLQYHIPSLWTQSHPNQVGDHVHPCLHHQPTNPTVQNVVKQNKVMGVKEPVP